MTTTHLLDMKLNILMMVKTLITNYEERMTQDIKLCTNIFLLGHFPPNLNPKECVYKMWVTVFTIAYKESSNLTRHQLSAL